MKDRPSEAVTFVENHDVVRDNPIINDKMLAYAFILTCSASDGNEISLIEISYT